METTCDTSSQLLEALNGEVEVAEDARVLDPLRVPLAIGPEKIQAGLGDVPGSSLPGAGGKSCPGRLRSTDADLGRVRWRMP